MVVENVAYKNEQNATNEEKEQRKSRVDRTNESPSQQEGQKQGNWDKQEDKAILSRRDVLDHSKPNCALCMLTQQSKTQPASHKTSVLKFHYTFLYFPDLIGH